MNYERLTIAVILDVPHPESEVFPVQRVEQRVTLTVPSDDNRWKAEVAGRQAKVMVENMLNLKTRPQDGGPPAMQPESFRARE